MFSNSISLVTAAMMLAHTVWGCCWHHLHGDECGATSARGSVAVADAHLCGCPHAHSRTDAHGADGMTVDAADATPGDHDSRGDEDEGHRHGPCNDVRCSFVNVKTSSHVHDVIWSAWAATMPVTIAAASVEVGSACCWSEASNPALPMSAPSLCAVTQSWLL